MDIHNLKGKVTLKWLNFNKYSTQILELRKTVFVEQQGFDLSFIYMQSDNTSIHLGAFLENELVSIISYSIIKGTNPLIKALNLPDTLGYKFQPTKRVELLEFRGTRLAELVGVYAWKSFVDYYQPDYSFIELVQMHKKLALYYSSFGFKFYSENVLEGEEMTVYLQDEQSIDNIYSKFKRLLDIISTILDVNHPSLKEFLQENPNIEQPIEKKISKDNLYLKTLSFKDELPRLLAQGRLLRFIQRETLKKVIFPKGPANLLDIGCGPGLYLTSLSKNPIFKDYKFTGLDISPDMITYARLSFRKISWKEVFMILSTLIIHLMLYTQVF